MSLKCNLGVITLAALLLLYKLFKYCKKLPKGKIVILWNEMTNFLSS